jgi:hypothetical protein
MKPGMANYLREFSRRLNRQLAFPKLVDDDRAQTGAISKGLNCLDGSAGGT